MYHYISNLYQIEMIMISYLVLKLPVRYFLVTMVTTRWGGRRNMVTVVRSVRLHPPPGWRTLRFHHRVFKPPFYVPNTVISTRRQPLVHPGNTLGTIGSVGGAVGPLGGMCTGIVVIWTSLLSRVIRWSIVQRLQKTVPTQPMVVVWPLNRNIWPLTG